MRLNSQKRTLTQKKIIIGAVFWVSSLFWGVGIVHSKLDPWAKATGMVEKLRQTLVTSQCEVDFKSYVGCLSALETLAARTPNTELVADLSAETSAALAFGRVKESFGALKWVEKSDSVLPSMDAYSDHTLAAQRKKYVRNRNHRINEFRIIYETTLRLRNTNGGVQNLNSFDEVYLIPFEKAFQRLWSSASLRQQPGESLTGLAVSAFNSYLSSVYDPHTRLEPMLTDQDREDAFNETHLIAGIGVYFVIRGDSIYLTPLRDSQALKAGLQRGDELLEVDGYSVVGRTTSEAKTAIAGKPGTFIKLKIRRKDKNRVIFVERALMRLPNVSAQVVESLGARMGWIRIETFSDMKACERLEQGLRDLLAKDIQGLILDLRGNRGGFVSQAQCIAGLFMGKKLLYSQQKISSAKPEEKQQKYATRDSIIPPTLPVVTLVDASSASCSEMVAGALQDHMRSWILGESTYGKATIQESSHLIDGAVFYKSTFRFFQPSGRTNQIVGIMPDIEIIDPATGPGMVYREADLYWNALPALGSKWSQPRPEEIEKIHRCRAKLKYTDAAYEEERNHSPISVDYTLIAAQEVLVCSRF